MAIVNQSTFLFELEYTYGVSKEFVARRQLHPGEMMAVAVWKDDWEIEYKVLEPKNNRIFYRGKLVLTAEEVTVKEDKYFLDSSNKIENVLRLIRRPGCVKSFFGPFFQATEEVEILLKMNEHTELQTTPPLHRYALQEIKNWLTKAEKFEAIALTNERRFSIHGKTMELTARKPAALIQEEHGSRGLLVYTDLLVNSVMFVQVVRTLIESEHFTGSRQIWIDRRDFVWGSNAALCLRQNLKATNDVDIAIEFID